MKMEQTNTSNTSRILRYWRWIKKAYVKPSVKLYQSSAMSERIAFFLKLNQYSIEQAVVCPFQTAPLVFASK